MKYLLCILCAAVLSYSAASQSVAINTDGSVSDGSALLDLKSTTKGLLIPRVVSTANVPSPAPGLLVYQSAGSTGFYYNAGSSSVPVWRQLVASGGIVNADISSSAAIVYSKLNLTNSIAGSDLLAGLFNANISLTLANNTNTSSELRFAEPSGSGTNYSAFKAQAQSASYTYTLPNTGPTTPNQVLLAQAIVGTNSTLAWGNTPASPTTFQRILQIAAPGNTSYTAASTDEIIAVDQTQGTPFTVTLPPATTAGKIIIIKLEKQNTTTFPNLAITAGGTDKIDNSNASVTFANAGGNRRFYSTGTGDWYTW